MSKEHETEQIVGTQKSFLLVGEIDAKLSQKAVFWLASHSRSNPEQKLTFFIDSEGGYVDDVLKIFDAFGQVPNPIRTVAAGRCYSGASLLLAAGTKGQREAWENTSFSIHQMQIEEEGLTGSLPQVVKEVKTAMRLNRRFMRLMAGCLNMPVKELLAKTQDDWNLTAQDALKAGLIDRIVPRKKKYAQRN